MTYKRWKQLVDEEGIDGNSILFLQMLANGEEIDLDHPKSAAILSVLERKELILGTEITQKGTTILNGIEISSKNSAKKEDLFSKWWEIYPSTDAFTLDGRKFMGTQSKKLKKVDCKKLFDAAIKEGTSPEDIIRATAYHIEQAKKLSLKKGESQLSYIPNSERYLRNKVYEPFIDASKEETKEIKYQSNIV